MLITDNTPTSDLLEIKINHYISDNKGKAGLVSHINIVETDEFWLFIFTLNNAQIIEIRKIKTIC